MSRIYSTVILHVSTARELKRDVNQTTILLKQYLPAWQFTRLEIHGPVADLPQDSDEEGDGDEEDDDQADTKPASVGSVGIARTRNEQEAEDLRLYNKDWTKSGLGRWGHSSSCTKDSDWSSLATLTSSLPSLKDVLWITDEVLRPCLLAAIESHPANPRLHLETFRFHCMFDPTKPSVLDAHELVVATSKNLYSITFNGADPGMNHHDTILAMVAGATPNLKSVTYFRIARSMSRAGGKREKRTAREKWRKSVPAPKPRGEGKRKENAIGTLEKLRLVNECFEDWKQVTDSGTLKNLYLSASFSADQLRCAIGEKLFPALESLAMSLHHSDDWPPGGLTPPDSQLEWFALFSDFLESLPPLRKLWLDGIYGTDNVKSLLGKQAESLKHLWIMPEDWMDFAPDDDMTFPCPCAEVEGLERVCRGVQEVKFSVQQGMCKHNWQHRVGWWRPRRIDGAPPRVERMEDGTFVVMDD